MALVLPFAFLATTFAQRVALAVLFATAIRAGFGAPTARRPIAGLVVLAGCLVVLGLTTPQAARSEGDARAAIAERGGQRLLRLGEPARARARFEEAERVSSGAARLGLAAAHRLLAEDAVAAGLSADGYRAAGDHLQAALASDPNSRPAADLAEAVAAIRQADVIWNQYDWPATLAELRKAEHYRPDLPGLHEKIRDAEVSAARGGLRSP